MSLLYLSVLHTECKDSLAEWAGEIERSVLIPFAWKFEYLVGQVRVPSMMKATQTNVA
jgi:hypothetical protein